MNCCRVEDLKWRTIERSHKAAADGVSALLHCSQKGRSKQCPFPVGRESRGKGKRRFAPQGVWRSGGHMSDAEPVVLLPGTVQRPTIPQPLHEAAGSKARRKDEFHLAEVGSAKSRILVVLTVVCPSG